MYQYFFAALPSWEYTCMPKTSNKVTYWHITFPLSTSVMQPSFPGTISARYQVGAGSKGHRTMAVIQGSCKHNYVCLTRDLFFIISKGGDNHLDNLCQQCHEEQDSF